MSGTETCNSIEGTKHDTDMCTREIVVPRVMVSRRTVHGYQHYSLNMASTCFWALLLIIEQITRYLENKNL